MTAYLLKCGMSFEPDSIIRIHTPSQFGALAHWRRHPRFTLPDRVHCSIPRPAVLCLLTSFLRSLPRDWIFSDFDISVREYAGASFPSQEFLETMSLVRCVELSMLDRRQGMGASDCCVPFRTPVGDHSMTEVVMISDADYLRGLPSLQWMTAFLNSTHLSVLYFTVPTMTLESWSVLLGGLTLPHLIDLGLDGNIKSTSAYAFLVRHPNITRLWFGKGLPVWTRDLSPTQLLTLPKLAEIAAPLSQMYNILYTLCRNLLRLEEVRLVNFDAIDGPICEQQLRVVFQSLVRSPGVHLNVPLYNFEFVLFRNASVHAEDGLQQVQHLHVYYIPQYRTGVVSTNPPISQLFSYLFLPRLSSTTGSGRCPTSRRS